MDSAETKRSMPRLPQDLGGFIAAEDPKLAQAGFETAELIQTAQPPPDGAQSSYREQKKQGIKRKNRIIQAQADKMAAEGIHPRQIGAFVASRTGFVE